MKNNIEKMVQDNQAMKVWHETMAKASADAMQDHIKAAAWHDSQSNMLKGMIEVPLDPEEKKTTIPAGNYSATPTPKGGMSSPTKEVPLDPSTVKKADLIALLSDHAEHFGDFDMEIDAIADFLINE